MTEDIIEEQESQEEGLEPITSEIIDQGVEEAEQQGDVDTLVSELNSWQEKANEYLDGWQRSRAEFANYKKRVERDQSQVFQNAAGNIIKRYLDILDDLGRALKNRPVDGDGAVWAEGIELIYRKFQTLLESEGVTAMQVEGEFFDPNQHEAITQEENEQYESGQIIEVLKQGYMLGDRVLRPAQVRIAR